MIDIISKRSKIRFRPLFRAKGWMRTLLWEWLRFWLGISRCCRPIRNWIRSRLLVGWVAVRAKALWDFRQVLCCTWGFDFSCLHYGAWGTFSHRNCSPAGVVEWGKNCASEREFLFHFKKVVVTKMKINIDYLLLFSVNFSHGRGDDNFISVIWIFS